MSDDKFYQELINFVSDHYPEEYKRILTKHINRTSKSKSAGIVSYLASPDEIEFVFKFAKGIANAFNESKSSNTYFWMQEALPESTVEWNSVQEILDKILAITRRAR
jgi:hypothetical protein